MVQGTKRLFGVRAGGNGEVSYPMIPTGEVQIVPVNVYDAESDLTVQAPLPGVLPEDITIEVEPRRLRIHADLRGGQTYQEYTAHEWHYGPYEREVELPLDVDATRANVSFGNGVLTISLPKAVKTQPVRIDLHRPMPLEGHSGHPPETHARHAGKWPPSP